MKTTRKFRSSFLTLIDHVILSLGAESDPKKTDVNPIFSHLLT
ncbi:hypothetical protein AB4539_01485 [Vibrio splendidus]|nr:hypothetical protein [Vibrio sp. SG41-7]